MTQKNYSSAEKVVLFRRHLTEKVVIADLRDELGLNVVLRVDLTRRASCW